MNNKNFINMTLFDFFKKVANGERDLYCEGIFNNKWSLITDKMISNIIEINKRSFGNFDDVIGNSILDLIHKNFFSENDSYNMLEEYENTVVKTFYFIEENDSKKDSDDLLNKFFNIYRNNNLKEINILVNGNVVRIIKLSEIAEICNNNGYVEFLIKNIGNYSINAENIINVYNDERTIYISTLNIDKIRKITKMNIDNKKE